MTNLRERIAALPPEGRARLVAELQRRRHSVAPAPLQRRDPAAGGFPLSFAQESLWIEEQLHPGNVAANVAGAFRLLGTLERHTLERCFEEIVRRHEVLRTRFEMRGGRPAQVVSPASRLAVADLDLCHLPAPKRDAAAHRAFTAEAQRPFDLSRGPLLRPSLVRLADSDHFLFLNAHHIVCDALSVQIFVRELTALYRARARPENASLRELPIQYGDFARWQREWLRGERVEQSLSYWRRQLAGLPPTFELPTDRPRPAGPSRRGALESRTFGAPLTVRLLGLTRSQGATPFMALLAALQALLWRYTGREDAVVLSTVANRTHSEYEHLIGCFINLVPLRADLSGDPTVTELLARVRGTSLGSFAHLDLPFAVLVNALRPQRAGLRRPFSSITFVFEGEVEERFDLGDLVLQEVVVDPGTADTDLVLHACIREGRLHATARYSTDLFRAATIARLLEHLELVLGFLLEDGGRRLSRLPALSLLGKGAPAQAVEVREPSGENRGGAPPVGDGAVRADGVVALFARQLQAAPARTALKGKDVTITYSDLDARAGRVARRLRQLAVGADVVVALVAERGPDLLAGMLAVWRSGGAYLPLDAREPAQRLRSTLEQSGCRIALVADPFVAKLSAVANEIPAERRPRLLRLSALQHAGETEGAPGHGAAPQSLAYVIYTSGSTGVPKGAMVEQRGMLNHLWAKVDALQLGSVDVVAQTASQCFDISVWQFIAPLLVGGCTRVFDDDVVRNPTRLLAEVERDRVSVLELVPSLLRCVLGEIEADTSLRRTLAGLRWLILTGEALPPELCRRWLALYPSVPILNAYGPTECSDDVTHHVVRVPPAEPRVPIGRAIANLRTYVLDRRLRPVPIGVPGELCIGGVGVGRGYLNDPVRTDRAFVADPFAAEPGARMYRTGDLVRCLADGSLDFLGRIDHQVKIRGFRIEPGEIESALHQHPGVREAVLVAREDGRGEKRLVAYLTASGRTGPGAGELREFLKERLPDYMIPAAFVCLDRLPLTPNGKIDRQALPPLDFGAPESELTAQSEEARNAVEATLVRIWRELLDVERIGIHDNFFERGGDSILSIQVVARAREAGLKLTPSQIFDCQTIAELAPLVESAPAVVAEQDLVTGPVTLTPIQRAFFETDAAEPHHFNQSVLLRPRRPLLPHVLAAAVEHLLRHHDALRLRFAKVDGAWEQWIAGPDGVASFASADLSGAARDPAEAMRAAAAEVQASLDLHHGPLLRAVLFELGPSLGQRLLIVVHHLAVDGVSWRILLEDLEASYGQLSRGETVALPAKTTSFQTWAGRLLEYARSASAREEIAYWSGRADAMVPRLPVDGAGANPEGSVRTVVGSLDRAETEEILRRLPSLHHVEINEILLTALLEATCQWTQQGRLLVDVEGHGREDLFADIDLSRTVGWFTTVFPVLLERPDGPASAADVLHSVKEQMRRMPKRGFGYGVLRYLSADAAELGALREAPSPQIGFNYMGQFDRVLPKDCGFGPAFEDAGPERSQSGERPHLIDLVCHVSEGRLQTTWQYSEGAHRRDTVERLAACFLDACRRLVGSAGSARLTTADVPLARLDETRLQRLLAAHPGVEDIYPLSPAQRGMLAHVLAARRSLAYVFQISCTARGPFDVQAMQAAVQRMVDRHPALRTSFAAADLPEPLQLVHARAPVSVRLDDWRGRRGPEQSEELSVLCAEERQRPFALDDPPLLRMRVVRLAEDSHRLVWTNHHLISDGWCMPLLLRECFALYEGFARGEELELPGAKPYRDYIAWLDRQDAPAAVAFWRRNLAGFTAPTSLPLLAPGADRAADPGAFGLVQTRLSSAATARLRAFAVSRGVTLSTLLQAAWAAVLHHGGSEDVVFGAVVSGRTPAIDGVEGIIGPFINAIPVRSRLIGEPTVGRWLKDLQASQVSARQYEYSQMDLVRRSSEIPLEQPLFESVVIFQNYPGAGRLELAPAELAIEDLETVGVPQFALTLEATVRGAALALELSYALDRADPRSARRILAGVRRALALLAENPDGRLGDLMRRR